MEKRVENRNKRKLDLDWDQVFIERNDDQPAELIVEKDGPPTAASNAYSDDSASGDEIDPKLPDAELEFDIKRKKKTYDTYRFTLRDKGEKLVREIKRLEDERKRRRLLRPEIVCLVRIYS